MRQSCEGSILINTEDFLKKLFSLSGKTAIVTGGSRGIGEAIALAYKNAGARVITVGTSSAPRSKELEGDYHQCDIKNRKSFLSLCSKVIEDQRRLDILVNVAAVSLPFRGSADEVSRFRETIETNLDATYGCCLDAANAMSEGGSIINVTSIGAYQGFPENPGYVASKGGVQAMTRALAIDFSARRIRVNNLVPGYVLTKMTEKSFHSVEEYEKRAGRTILGRWAEPEDLAGAAIFLASEAAQYITGSDLVVDGGWVGKGL